MSTLNSAEGEHTNSSPLLNSHPVLKQRKNSNRIRDEARQTHLEHKGGNKEKRQWLAWQRGVDISHFSLNVYLCHLALSLEHYMFSQLAVNLHNNDFPLLTQTQGIFLPMNAISNNI